MTAIWDISGSCVSLADAPSETLTEGTPHHPHLLLTNQHENADVSFIDLRSYIPEISGVRSSKLPPLLRGGDKKSRGCGLQNCHPFLGVAINTFTRLSIFDSPKASSDTFKTDKNINLYFKRKHLIIYIANSKQVLREWKHQSKKFAL